MAPREKHSSRSPKVPREVAEHIAGRALAFIAADETRLTRFFAETGIAPQDLRAAAADPGFAGHLLAHLATDESEFVAFAHEVDRSPADLDRLRLHLVPPESDA